MRKGFSFKRRIKSYKNMRKRKENMKHYKKWINEIVTIATKKLKNNQNSVFTVIIPILKMMYLES